MIGVVFLKNFLKHCGLRLNPSSSSSTTGPSACGISNPNHFLLVPPLPKARQSSDNQHIYQEHKNKKKKSDKQPLTEKKDERPKAPHLNVTEPSWEVDFLPFHLPKRLQPVRTQRRQRDQDPWSSSEDEAWRHLIVNVAFDVPYSLLYSLSLSLTAGIPTSIIGVMRNYKNLHNPPSWGDRV